MLSHAQSMHPQRIAAEHRTVVTWEVPRVNLSIWPMLASSSLLDAIFLLRMLATLTILATVANSHSNCGVVAARANVVNHSSEPRSGRTVVTRQERTR